MITASLVTYKNSAEDLYNVLSSALSTPIRKIYIVDHSPYGEVHFILHKDPRLKKLLRDSGDIVEYDHAENRGFGAGHNRAIRKSMELDPDYHIILNPDIRWNSADRVVEKLACYMDKHPEAGMIAPKVLFPDGRLQYTCKLLPSPLDLIGRRFLPKSWRRSGNEKFELHFTGHDHIMNVPYIHGCFMMFRIDTLQKTGLFDERFFMYPEDIDITRRIHEVAETIYYPEVSIYHVHGAASRKFGKMLWIHIVNMIKYFNKWGWIFDSKRRNANKALLSSEKKRREK
ncbi:MAG: glycosyltransferase family 2 protein [Muribaculaceae bacterium]|nr:glycosyltransferase family 2 protein [Muribaculaceae bacterium]